ncbi:MAG: nucleotide exchange factor GrpE [Myxococcales bacterium]|nr:nucleotide exchange factor GrpE [Myxococcales bacterium]
MVEPNENDKHDELAAESTGGEAVEGVVEDTAAGEPGAAEASAEKAAESAPQPPRQDPRDLRIQHLERALQEREATLHAYIRAHKKAEQEYEAFKERARRDQDRELQAARGRVVERMLEFDESFERTIQAVERGGTIESLLEGLRLIHRLFVERLAELGAERVDPTGEPFDPTTMEALGILPVSDPRLDGKVAATLRAGYRVGDREIRPALVQVGRLIG